MTSVLDTQAAAAAQTIADIQVTTAVTQSTIDQEMDEKIPFKILKMQVSSFPNPTINLVDSDLEEEVIAFATITEDMDQYLQPFTDLLNRNGKKFFIHVPTA